MRKLFICLLFTLATISVFAQSIDLNTAIKNGAAYFEQNLQGGSTVAVLSIRSDSLTLSEYVIDELSSYLVNGRTFTVVDRANIGLIQQEMNYQLSGDVSDETAQSIGKRIDAETVITGAIQPLGDEYRLDLRALSVETGVIQGVTRQNIRPDNVLASLVEGINVLPSLDSWKNNWLYLGIRAGGGFVPSFINNDSGYSNFNMAFSLTGQITEWFGIQTEIMYSYNKWEDNPSFWDSIDLLIGYGKGTGSHGMLTVPLLARFMFRPNNFSFGVIGGAYIALPIGTRSSSGTVEGGIYQIKDTLKNPNAGIMAGVNFGYHIGFGVLFFDIRAYHDIMEAPYEAEGYTIVNNQRTNYTFSGSRQAGAFNFCIGYEIGILPKARR
jgi:hypothetical protein